MIGVVPRAATTSDPFNAIAEPRRRDILDYLAGRERPVGDVVAALLEQLGPSNETHDGKPLPMKIEPWPGGRWFRDLGDHNGHFWGHVQAIKQPTLLEITGPLMMSAPVVSNMQYRLKQVDGGT